MGHTNSTSNYNLPQFIGSDKPAWLTDINTAFSDIDTAIKAADNKAVTASTTATNAANTAASAASAATAAQNTANSADGKANNNASAITTMQGQIAALQTTVGLLNSKKHVTNSGTQSGWVYDEYSDGTIRMRYHGSISFENAGSQINGWYRSTKSVSLPFNVNSNTAIAYGGGAVSGRLFAVSGIASSSTVEVQLLSGASFAGGVTVTNADIVVEGTKI